VVCRVPSTILHRDMQSRFDPKQNACCHGSVRIMQSLARVSVVLTCVASAAVFHTADGVQSAQWHN
jgi:hypothetical protein